MIGEASLTAVSGLYLQVGTPVQGVPVFQGDASGNYVLTSPVAGLITSWSFRSAGARAVASRASKIAQESCKTRSRRADSNRGPLHYER